MSLMVSISGVRGVVGSTLTPETVVKYSSAFGEYCKRGRIIVGRDGRLTGKSIGHLVNSTLLSMGCDVIALGVAPTPTVALAVEKLRASGGIAITASHNPMDWNGLKFFARTGLFLDAEQNEMFWRIAKDGARKYVPWNKQGSFRAYSEFSSEHIRLVLSIPYLNIGLIRQRKFKVVLDCVNASGGTVVPNMLRELGCEVVEMNCDVSGVFAHTPEPIPENIGSVCRRVKSAKADLGIVVDPDADRLVLIDENGEPLGEEYTVATAVHFVLGKMHAAGKKTQTVVVNLSTTRAIDDIARMFGARVLRTPVGEINVAKRMKETGAIVGGEGSGGVILPSVHLGRDSLVGIALTLQHLAEFRGSLSALKSSLPQYVITKGKVDVGRVQPDDALRALEQEYRSQGSVSTADGLKIDFPDTWVHLRRSNTEPIIRIIAEATSRRTADELVKAFQRRVRSFN